MTNRVTCIKKPDRHSQYDAIVSLGGTRTNDGAHWTCTRQQCVDYIKQGYVFYVQIGLHRVNLIVGKSARGTEYVRTDPDQDTQDNLLSLPECP